MYTLDIASDGVLTFKGGSYTAVQGTHHAVVAPAVLRKVAKAIVDGPTIINQHTYRPWITGISLTVSNDKQKPLTRWIDFDRDQTFTTRGHPIIDEIDDLIDIERWVAGSDQTAAALAAEAWDFSRTDLEAMKVIVGVAMHGTSNGVLDLLRRGAPISIAQQRNAKATETTNILGLIGKRGDDRIVDALLATELQWTKEELSDAAIGLAYDGKLASVRQLIARGARPQAAWGIYVPDTKRSDQLNRLFRLGINYQPQFGLTLLQAAASSGNPDLVTLALRYDPRMKQRSSYSLLELAGGIGRGRRPTAAAADRNRAIALLRAAGAR